jgi:SPX domain protein involved in polyphosphate accumulation
LATPFARAQSQNGDTVRSAWSSLRHATRANLPLDNIDYDYLKDLIKHQTTPGTNKAVSIPGQGESSERAFGESFLHVLQAQHDRINLFVRSKSGEIERRLEHISKTLEQLQQKQHAYPPGARLPARVVERYAKIDADVTRYVPDTVGAMTGHRQLTRGRIGEEIRSLSRFQVVQRTGFTKILKKYRRWTKDRELNQAFKEQIVSHPNSLFQLDLSYLLDHYIAVLGALRAIFDSDGASTANAESDNAQSAAARISRTLERGDELDFDLALTTIPLGSHGNRATYWIHPDHFVEAKVLLLQQMRLYTSKNSCSSRVQSAHATPARRKSSSGNTDRFLGVGDDVGLLVLDHPEAFAIKQNASTIGSTEATKGNIVFKAAGNVHCVSSGDAAVVVCADTKGQQQATSKIKTVRCRVNSLQSFWDQGTSPSEDRKDNEPQGQESGGGSKDITAIRQWLTEHGEARPIAGVGSKRTRFIGLQNNSAGGVWATLDKDVYMKDSMSKDLASDDWPSVAQAKSIKFPHAILEVRREGTQAASLIQTLDRSHLVCRTSSISEYSDLTRYSLSVFVDSLSKHTRCGHVASLVP